MLFTKKHLYLLMLAVLSLLLLMGCPKQSEDVSELPPDDASKIESLDVDSSQSSQPGFTTTQPVTSGEIDRTPTGGIRKFDSDTFQIVYFDFDKYNLRPDAIDSLMNNLQLLKSNLTIKILIEGHCDERGTNEYNQALGMKRANACRDYLITNGIDANRIQVISYGEERPVDPGHDEIAWAKNRRGAFVVISQ